MHSFLSACAAILTIAILAVSLHRLVTDRHSNFTVRF